MKRDRVLTLEFEEYLFHDEGAYADIFVNETRTRCWKVFKIKEPISASVESFQSELIAYERSIGHAVVAKMVPKLFRSRYSNLQVQDKHGKDVSFEYISGLNYEMEFLDLKFFKIGLLVSEGTQNIRNSFKEAGIFNVSDASIAFDMHGNPKLIDFSIQEIEVWH